MERIWKIKSEQTEFADTNEIIQQLLRNRGIEDSHYFLNPPETVGAEEAGLDPKEQEKAVSLIKQALKENLPLIIHGDYDADGLCATALLWETFYYNLGYKNVIPFIPNRAEHGYGLSKKSIDAILEKLAGNPGLLITVDVGITGHSAIEYAQKAGLKVIVTDHHQKDSAKNKADSVLWSDSICGTAVAWFLARSLDQIENVDSGSTQKLDLVALATIADLQPLTGVNRFVVKKGLAELNRKNRIGLKTLIKKASLLDREIGTYEVGWILAPRLNASGRLGDGMSALRLLCTRSLSQAEDLASKLSTLNLERQKLTEEQVTHALNSISKSDLPKIVLASHDSYHEGITGLIAGKLCQKLYRPAIAISKGEPLSKGSVRSIPEVNIIEFLREFESLFESLGGHPAAAGFTIKTENIDRLTQELTDRAEILLEGKELRPALEVDFLLPENHLSWDLVEAVARLAPFGLGNPSPLFVSQNLQVLETKTVGSESKHLKMKVADTNRRELDTIGFGLGFWEKGLAEGDSITLAHTPEENVWNGKRTLQLKVRGIKKLDTSN